MSECKNKAYFHLPGLFEFYELYRKFLPLFSEHREWFYDWCGIGSIYGAPADCIWGGGRVGSGNADPRKVLKLTEEYGISARLTFSNSLLREEHLRDKKCNALCALFERSGNVGNGVIVHSDLLLEYLADTYYCSSYLGDLQSLGVQSEYKKWLSENEEVLENAFANIKNDKKCSEGGKIEAVFVSKFKGFVHTFFKTQKTASSSFWLVSILFKI